MQRRERVVLPPNDGSLRHRANVDCTDCGGDGRVILTFRRMEPPRVGSLDYEVIACDCVKKGGQVEALTR